MLGGYETGIPVVCESIFVTFRSDPLIRLTSRSFPVENLDVGTGDVSRPLPEPLPVGSRTDRDADLFRKTDANRQSTAFIRKRKCTILLS